MSGRSDGGLGHGARRRALSVLVCGTTLAAALLGLTRPVAAATANPKRPPVVAGSDYLALGDSVTFGYREPATRPPPDYHDPSSFVGYPTYVARAYGMKVANLSCPGETSSSLIDTSAKSYGCEGFVVGGRALRGGYRTAYPLHVSYSGSQLAAATSYLATHHRTRLVSLMIGANDLFVCQAAPGGCSASAEDRMLSTVGGNVAHILAALRRRYAGQLVVVDYYTPRTSGTTGTALLALDSAVNAAARPYRVQIANGAAAFAAADRYAGSNPCGAGLLTQLSSGGCGIHPSPSGQSVLAQAVEDAVIK